MRYKPLKPDAESSVPVMQTYRRLLTYAWGYRKCFALAIAGMAAYAATDTGFAALMKPLLDEGFAERGGKVGAWLPLAMVGVLTLRGVSAFLASYYMAYVGQHVSKQLRSELFQHLLRLPVSYYDDKLTGEVVSKLTYNVGRTSSSASKALTIVVRDSLTALGLIGWMFYINWMLTLIFLALTPVVAYLMTRISRRFRKASHKLQEAMGFLTSDVEQVVRANRTIKVFGGQDYALSSFEKSNERNRRYEIQLSAVKAAGTPLIMFIVGLSLAGIVYLATFETFTDYISIGAFTSFVVATVLLFRPVRNLVNVNALVQQGIAAAESVFNLLDTPPERDTQRRTNGRFPGAVRFVGVSHRYAADADDVLADVNLDVTAGETVALVGRSGAGKSTLVNLLPRLYDCTGGRIELDGHDVRDISLSELRAQIAYVGQNVTLFHDTVRNNIVYGREVGAQELREMAEKAHALDFIEKLPQGFDTIIGDDGVRLSGGQRQRIALARALLKRAPVMIFDEATSALDAESERAVRDALEEITRGRTVIIIAHRFPTVERADRIVVMADGRIVEQGSHDELLEKQGVYYDLRRAAGQDGLIE